MDTLVVGLDGGEWDVISPMIENGELPNISGVKSEGISGELTSTTPPVSAPAWNSILTGTNPGKHGIFDFVNYNENYDRVPNNASNRSATPFWEVLNDHGTSTGLFKVPFTYPTEELAGFMVAGFPAPSSTSDFTYPRSLKEQVGPLDALFEEGTLIQESRYEAFHKNLDDVAQYQTDQFLNLVDDFGVDLGMIVYDSIDRAQHTFWKHFDQSHPDHNPDSEHIGRLEAHYKFIDKQLGRIFDTIDNNTDIIILSDHGFGQLTDYISIDKWLESEGFLQWESQLTNPIENLIERVLELGWRAAGTANIQTVIKSIFPSSIFEFGSDLQKERNIDWPETQAFFGNLSGQAIFVNTTDRFNRGCISEAEYDTYITQIKESLRFMQHPESGEALIQSVIHSDELFHGWCLEDAPDLIILPNQKYSVKGGQSESLVSSSTTGVEDRSGDHRPEGILIAEGPSFTTGTFEDASIFDITPTLLHLHQSPIPESVDGSVMHELFDANKVDTSDINTTDKYNTQKNRSGSMDEEAQAEVEDRLSDLGYLS